MKKAPEPIPVLDGYDIERASLTDSGFFQRFSVPSQLPLLTDSGMGDSYREIDSYPPGFKKTMGAIDQRLPEHTSGLGVIVDGQAKFYPFSELEDRQTDQWGEDRRSPPMGGENGQERPGPLIKAPILLIQWGEGQEAPMAVWEDGAVPVQLLTRWYGFSYSYPDCGIYQGEEE